MLKRVSSGDYVEIPDLESIWDLGSDSGIWDCVLCANDQTVKWEWNGEWDNGTVIDKQTGIASFSILFVFSRQVQKN